MYRRIADFEHDWAQETASTQNMLRVLTDESLDQRVTSSTRSVGRLAWHIAMSIPEILTAAKVPNVEGDAHSAPPSSAAEIVAGYQAAAGSVVPAVRAAWSDDQLADEIPMYGMTWTKGHVLSLLIRHEAHHRGQLSIAMRHAGLAPPGPYGPAREEWASMGMEAME
jgi:uncharacterized damage-inducible protein DinB